MSEPFIAEIKIFAGTFAPRGYSLCNGQLLPISQNTALFAVIGTTYGGDGRSTTALPNLQGRMPMHPGRGPGLTSRRLGERVGVEDVTLSEAQMPNHNHTALGNAGTVNNPAPDGNWVGRGNESYNTVVGTGPSLAQLAPETAPPQGGGQSHTNLSPYLVLNFIIALVGTFPSRS